MILDVLTEVGRNLVAEARLQAQFLLHGPCPTCGRLVWLPRRHAIDVCPARGAVPRRDVVPPLR